MLSSHLCSLRSLLTASLIASFKASLLVSCGLLSADTKGLTAGDWPQFRGPNCSGIAADAVNLPISFSPAENNLWSTSVGDGIGGVCIVGDRVFVSGMRDAQTIQLQARELKTGRQIWERQWHVDNLPEIHETNSHASSTPAADKDRVYFYCPSLGLVAVDSRTGNNVWTFDIPSPFFVFKWGPGMSPVLCDDLVVFCQDDDLHPAIYALHKSDGRLAWKDERTDMAVNYSHPVVNESGDGREIVVAGTGMVIGYDPVSGRRKWFVRGLLRNIKTTPVCHQGIIYISLQSSGIANQWLVAIDQAETGNHDGRIDEQETQAFFGEQPIPAQFFERTFRRGDKDGNGFLEGEELDSAFLFPGNFAGASFQNLGEKAADEYILAVRGGGEGDVTESHLLWKHATRHTDHVVSPLLRNDSLFLIKSGGICTQFELATGKMLGSPRRFGNAANYFASPVAGAGLIYLAADNGKVTVLKDDTSLEQLAVNDLGESIVATPAIAGSSILFRTRTMLYCIGSAER